MLKSKQKGIWERVFLIALAIFGFSLSLDPDWSSKALIPVIAVSLINIRINKSLIKAPSFYVVLLIFGYTLVNAWFFRVSPDMEMLSVPICLFMFFYVLVLSKKLNEKSFRITLYSFSAGVLLVGIANLMVYFMGSGPPQDFYEAWNKTTIVDIHKIYYGVYVNLMVAIIWHYTFINRRLNFLIFFIVLGFSWAMFYFTGAKSSMFINVVLLVLFLIQKMWTKKAKLITSIMTLLPIIIMLALSSTKVQGYFIKIDGEASRIRNYTINQKLILEKPLFGHGIGNEFNIMQKNRGENSWEYKNGYNAHNQYFHILLGGGLVLLAFYILVIFYVGNGSSNQFLLPSYFVLIVAYVCLIESFFERHHGAFFTTFFICLFIGWNKKLKMHDAQKRTDQ